MHSFKTEGKLSGPALELMEKPFPDEMLFDTRSDPLKSKI